MLSIKSVLVTLSLLTASTTLASPLDARANTCVQCVASPNNCDITAPCANAFGQKLFCGCRPGFRAKGYGGDTSKQWRLNVPFHEHRVWVAPGVKCDTLCDNPYGATACGEVTFIDKCIVWPPPQPTYA